MDGNGLDLSLSLPCGGQASSSKVNNGIRSEARAEEANEGSKLIDDFKNFLDCDNQKEAYVMGSQSSNQVKPEENLFYDLSNSTTIVDSSSNNNREFWSENESKSTEIQETRYDTCSKRKNLFDEINHNKRHEKEDVADSEPVIRATLPLMLGYSNVQMPTLAPGKKGSAEGCLTPGIGAEVKFGGSGLSSDLPWVSTTGLAPNGKTISGVTYKHNGTEVRVVCACHGSHMSVEEFVQHASEEQPNGNMVAPV